MRVTFTPPSENDFKQLFLSSPLRKGGGLEDISIFQPMDIPYRRGSGLLSVISGVAKKILPFLMRMAKPAAKEFGHSVVRDVIRKKPIRQSLKKNGVKALKNTGMRILKGSGNVKKGTLMKRTTTKNSKMKKSNVNSQRRYKLSIFD